MNIVPRDYQMLCVKTVYDQINAEEKHISLVMTSGFGLNTTSLFLANKLKIEGYSSVSMVFTDEETMYKTEKNSRELDVADYIVFFSVQEFLKIENTSPVVFFYEIDSFSRTQIEKHISCMDIKTVAFVNPLDCIENKNKPAAGRLLEYASRITNAPLIAIYTTKKVFDVRDARYMNDGVKLYEDKETLLGSGWSEIKKKQIIKDKEDLLERKDRLEKDLKAISTENQVQVLKEKEKEIEELRILLQEQERLLKEQDGMLSFHKEILRSFGIKQEAIDEAFLAIKSTRESLIEQLESKDEIIREAAMKMLQDKIADSIIEITKDSFSTNDNNHFEEYLKGELTEEVWNKLEEKSRVFLITAKRNYESMIRMEQRETFDYSGVCLLITKALEVETAKRFFSQYVMFLKKKYSSVSRWPFALRKKENGQYTETIIDEHEFTLGSVVSTLGYRRVGENSFEKGNLKTYNDFVDYSSRFLFKTNDTSIIEKELEKDIRFIEKVRVDFRNPAAHRDEISIISAKNCVEYVIEVQHMLREMLIVMRK